MAFTNRRSLGQPRRLPLVLLGRQPSNLYLFRDTFNNGAASYSDDAVRTCSPGPGEITIEGSSIAVSGNQLSLPAPSNSWASHHARATRFAGGGTTIAREAGRMVLGTAAYSGSANGSFLFGFCDAVPDNFDDAEEMIGASVGAITIINDTTTLSFSETFVSGTTYQLAVVLRAAGAFYFMKGGVFSDWTLIWITDARSNSNLIPAIVPFNRATTLDNWRVPKRLWTPAAEATLTDSAGFIAGTSYSLPALADQIIDIDVTRGAGAGGTTNAFVVLFRVASGISGFSNNWSVIIYDNGSVVLRKREGGVDSYTTLFSSGSIGTSATRILRAMMYGSTMRFYLHQAGSTTWTGYASNPVSDSSQSTSTIGYTAKLGTLSNLTPNSITVWKRTWSEGFPNV